ncbi:MAG: fumarylacetoacetate hydrolase family protein [Anaerovoracaceae bacterium]
MKIIRYKNEGISNIGILTEIDGKSFVSKLKVDHIDDLFTMNEGELEKLYEDAKFTEPQIESETVEFEPVIIRPNQDVICLGINYAAHAIESARFKKEAFGKERKKPIYFSKRVNRFVGDKEVIDGHFDIVDSLDYEAELAVIIGKPAKNVSASDAKEYIFGYTILNDMSARNLQTEHIQWYFGKSLDDFTPLGPAIVTRDEFSFPPELDIKSYVNGELRQNSNTRMLITSISEIIAELSKGITLMPGTIIATGTPEGVGMGFVPPNFLNKGDEVACYIEGIGTITNKIK